MLCFSRNNFLYSHDSQNYRPTIVTLWTVKLATWNTQQHKYVLIFIVKSLCYTLHITRSPSCRAAANPRFRAASGIGTVYIYHYLLIYFQRIFLCGNLMDTLNAYERRGNGMMLELVLASSRGLFVMGVSRSADKWTSCVPQRILHRYFIL